MEPSDKTLVALTRQHEDAALRSQFKKVMEQIKEQEAFEDFEDMPRGTQLLVDHVVERILQQGFAQMTNLDKDTIDAIAFEKSRPKEALRRMKRATRRIMKMGEETQEENEQLQNTMVPEHLKQIIRPKNLALWKRLIQELQYTDKILWQNVAGGFDVIGTIEKTGVWEPLEVPEEITKEDIKNYLESTEKLKLTRPSWMDDEILAEVQKDLRAGLEDGRYTEKELEELKAPPCKCFGIRQANKIRAIIDQRGLNKVTGYCEKMRLMGTSRIMEIIGAFAAPCGMEKQGLRVPGAQSAKEVHKNTVKMVLEAKETLAESNAEGSKKRRRTTWAAVLAAARLTGSTSGKKPGVVPQIRCEDWKGAYHQFGQPSCHKKGRRAKSGAKQLWANCLMFWDEGMQKWRGVESNVLNMGNKLSVPNFCRISEFIRFVCIRMAGVITSIYIDDGVMIHSSTTIEAAHEFYRALSEQLGMQGSDGR